MTTSAFAIAPLALATDSRLTLTDTRILLGLLSFAKPNTLTCWPSRKTLAERLGISSVSRISETIKRLESLGWLEVTRRMGSSLYRITPPLHPVVDAPPPPRSGQPEQTTEQTNFPPNPPSGGERASAPAEQPAPSCDEQRVAVAPEPEPPVRAQPPEPPATVAQRLVARLNAKAGSRLPEQAGIAHRRAQRALRAYSEQEIASAIDAKAREFRHPGALFKRSVLEAIVSQQKAAEMARQKRMERERAQIEQIQPEPGKATREGAARGIAALKAALGMRPKPTDDRLSA